MDFFIGMTKFNMGFELARPDVSVPELQSSLYNHTKIIFSEFCIVDKRVQYRYPRSKNKRIRKKWSKQSKNFKTIKEHVAYVLGRDLVMHPDQFAMINNIGSN